MRKMLCLFVLAIMASGSFVFSQTDNTDNDYLDSTSQRFKDLMSVFDRGYLGDLYEARYFNSRWEARDGINYFTLALNLYNETRYEESIDNYILAIKSDRTGSGLYYYHLGLCLMVAGNLEQAKKSFLEAIYHFFVYGDYSDDYDFYVYQGDLFSYDDNGIARETYFTFYNIACIESLQNNVDTAYEYLCEALFHGYPYINHIRNDEDLNNLFNDGNHLQDIERIYNAGSQNTVLGKIFDINIPAGYL